MNTSCSEDLSLPQAFWNVSTSEDGTKTWTTQSGERSYRLHTIHLPPAQPGFPSATISCLMNTTLLPTLLDNPASPLSAQGKPYAQPPLKWDDNPTFVIRHTPNKGQGMFAIRDIEAGELIAWDHPALILPSDKFPDEVYEALGDALPDERRGDLMRMANCREKDECATFVEGVVRTNAMVLQLELGGVKIKRGKAQIEEEKKEKEKEIYGGVYPLINKCNHSCGPNASVKWNLASLSVSLHALRPIKAGEEVFKSYVNSILPRAMRMVLLLKNYRFSCDCPWCDIRSSSAAATTGPAPAPDEPLTPDELKRIAESDAQREAISTWIFTHLGYKKWSTDLCRADDLIINEHQQVLALIEQEGVESLQILFIEEVAMAYAMLGDAEKFKEWGRRMAKLSRVEDPKMAEKFEEWVVDPERRVKKWGWRRKQRELMSKKKTGLELEPDIFQVFFDVDAM